jgi:pyroglutamyl-peptidase
VAYQSQLPLGDWATALRQEGIPTVVSYHAGTYLCNATLYLSHYVAEKRRLPTQSTFIHLPLDVSQAVDAKREVASLPAALGARAVHLIVAELVKRARLRDSELA